ncbi:serine hydrolase domain-containing protein [Actinomyces vulturis]|uniref:serine hydrolase domain-containing protein n=1 Tax=Actinomyces vulturis TaxID=1857645 RepID=UPI00082F8C7A|nr:serine hydrolase domain-containing protein [Actinomyces vulturis]
MVLCYRRSIVGAWGNVDEIYPLASVTKVIGAVGAWVAISRDQMSLDDPAGPEGSTIRHLLAHASGLAFDSDAVLSLPGTRRIYSNRGIEVMGDYLELSTGYGIEEWLETQVLEPLGMASTFVEGSIAHAGRGSARDVATLACELAAPTLVDAQLAGQACAPVFPDLDGVLPGYGRQTPNPFGLGVEVRGTKNPHWTSHHASPRTVGHFGQAGSFIYSDPDHDIQAAFVGTKPFNSYHRSIWPELNDAVYEWLGEAD